MPRTCWCGYTYGPRGRCERAACPRKTLGHGHWHIALPRLLKMSQERRLKDYPLLDLRGLRKHVEKYAARKEERKKRKHHRSRRRTRTPARDTRSSHSRASRTLHTAPKYKARGRSRGSLDSPDRGAGSSRSAIVDLPIKERRQRSPEIVVQDMACRIWSVERK